MRDSPIVMSAQLRPDWKRQWRCMAWSCKNWAIGQIKYYTDGPKDRVEITSFRCRAHSYGRLPW